MGEFLHDTFNQGPIGLAMILSIVFLGVMALAIALERFIVLYMRSSVDKNTFIANVQRAIMAGDLNSAVNYCNDRSTPLNNVVKAGLIAVMNRGNNEEIQTAMDVSALREIPQVERRTPFLALFANVATLLGLMTTIWGLIGAFKAVRDVDPAQKAAILAGEISLAMNGTALGLMVAVPTLLLSALLTAKTQRILDDVHEISVSTLNLIIQNREKFPNR